MDRVEYLPCLTCIWVTSPRHCHAFDGEIPEEILSGRNDHTTPYPGDNGKRYLEATVGMNPPIDLEPPSGNNADGCTSSVIK